MGHDFVFSLWSSREEKNTDKGLREIKENFY
jgi:hypothetical protein